VILILGALSSAILTGFGIATLTKGSTPVAPDQRLTASSANMVAAPTATPERQTRVLGASDTLDFPATAASNTPAPVLDIGTATADTLDPDAAASAFPPFSRFPQPTITPLIEDSFSAATSGWIVRDTPTWSAAYTDGQYQLALHGQNNLNLSSSIPAADYRLSVDVTVAQGGAGVVFLAAKPATFYRLMINVDDAYALQLQRQDEVIDIIPWTASPALRGTANVAQRLHVERRGATVQVFVNDQPLLDWSVPSGDTVNQYGFAVTAQQGAARATFDNLIVEPLLQP
jgi:hypothetical protein